MIKSDRRIHINKEILFEGDKIDRYTNRQTVSKLDRQTDIRTDRGPAS